MIDEIIKIVHEAGKIMLSAQKIQDSVKSKKGIANFVTKYDVEVQNFLYQELQKICPEAIFIGEEDDKKNDISEGYCFIIDPIDGTTNFIFDLKHSAISVALMYQNNIIAGVVYDPYLNETFSAELGKGAFLNGSPMKVNALSLSEGLAVIGTSPYYREKADETFLLARKIYDKAMDIRRSGSAALDLCYVAAGRYVLFYEMMLSPWDYAAASLMITEAGGCITTMDNKSLTVLQPCSVIAATPKAFQDYLNITK